MSEPRDSPPRAYNNVQFCVAVMDDKYVNVDDQEGESDDKDRELPQRITLEQIFQHATSESIVSR